MKSDLSFTDWYNKLFELTDNERIKLSIIRCKALWLEYYEEGKTPEAAFEEEWG